MKIGKIFFICGVSGAGKSTTIKNILKLGRDDIVYVPSYSSRIMRPGERQGNPYYFISKEEFEQAIKDGEFLEYAINHKLAYYGTKKDSIMKIYNQGKVAIKESDIKGYEKLVKSGELKGLYKCVFMDLKPEIMRRRIEGRSKLPEKEILNRLDSRNMEIKIAKKYCDYIINADDTIENNMNKVLDIIDGN